MLALADGPYALATLIASTIIMSLGMAPVITIGNEMIITAAPPERAGAASALSETSAEFGGAMGIAVFGSLGTVLYRHVLANDLPAGVAPDAAAAAMATLGGAVAAAHANPGPAGDALLNVSRAAFTDAMQVTSLLAMGIVVAASVVSAHILRAAPARAASERG